MSNLATRNLNEITKEIDTDYIVKPSGEGFVSLRKCGELCGVAHNSIVHFFKDKADISQGVSSENLQIVVQHYASKHRPSAIATLCLFAKAGAKAFIYHQAGYTLEAKKEVKPMTMRELLLYSLKVEEEKEKLLIENKYLEISKSRVEDELEESKYQNRNQYSKHIVNNNYFYGRFKP